MKQMLQQHQESVKMQRKGNETEDERCRHEHELHWMGFLHLCLHLIFSHMTQEIITTQQMPIPANSEKPV